MDAKQSNLSLGGRKEKEKKRGKKGNYKTDRRNGLSSKLSMVGISQDLYILPKKSKDRDTTKKNDKKQPINHTCNQRSWWKVGRPCRPMQTPGLSRGIGMAEPPGAFGPEESKPPIVPLGHFGSPLRNHAAFFGMPPTSLFFLLYLRFIFSLALYFPDCSDTFRTLCVCNFSLMLLVLTTLFSFLEIIPSSLLMRCLKIFSIADFPY